jgi:SAM-dependent methyltransferase
MAYRANRVTLGVKAILELMLDNWQYLILKRIAPPPADEFGPRAAESKLKQLLGEDFFSAIQDKVVVDFGCGGGADSIEMARIGARRVIGVDIREEVLRVGRENAERAGISGKCVFTTRCEEAADIVVSVDAFEHFEDPGLILRLMAELIGPEGEVYVSFGPTWYHPLGGHLFSVFPWAHLLFSEKALLRWRSDFKNDGAKKFGEVAGGLNQMTISRFEALVAASPLEAIDLTPVPIRRLQPVHFGWTREFTTAVVRCRLRHKSTKQR